MKSEIEIYWKSKNGGRQWILKKLHAYIMNTKQSWTYAIATALNALKKSWMYME